MCYIQRNIWRLDANKLIQIIILLWWPEVGAKGNDGIISSSKYAFLHCLILAGQGKVSIGNLK